MIDRLLKLERLVKWLYCKVKNGGTGGGIQSVQEGDNITVDNTDPLNPIVNSTGGGGTGIQSIQEGDNISIDNTDPLNPIINATGGGTSVTLEQARQNGNVLEGDIKTLGYAHEFGIFNGKQSNRLVVTPGQIVHYYGIIGASITTTENKVFIRGFSVDYDENGNPFPLVSDFSTMPLIADGYYNHDNNYCFVQKQYADEQHSYSTTETKTGGTWIDGKPLYKITRLTSDPAPTVGTMIKSTVVGGTYTEYEYTKP